MNKAYKIFKATILTAVTLTITVPLLLFVLLSLPAVQNSMRSKAETELTNLLGTPVTIKNLAIAPPNRITLREITVTDNNADTIATIHRLGVGTDLIHIIATGEISIDYAEILKLNLHIKKATPEAPLNIDHIIKTLSPKDHDKPKTDINLDIKTIVIRNSNVTYDVLSLPRLQDRFDKNHISVQDFRADITIPKITNTTYDISAKRISLTETSGLDIPDLHADVKINTAANTLNISNLTLKLPNTDIALQDIMADSNKKIRIATKNGTHITPSDLAPFAPQLAQINETLTTDIDITVSEKQADITRIDVKNKNINLAVKAQILNPTRPDSLNITSSHITLEAASNTIADILSKVAANLAPKAIQAIKSTGRIHLDTQIRGTLAASNASGRITTHQGKITYTLAPQFTTTDTTAHLQNIKYNITAEAVNLAALTQNSNFGKTTFTAQGSHATATHAGPQNTDVTIDIADITFKNHTYQNITATAKAQGKNITLNAAIDDPCAALTTELIATADRENRHQAYFSTKISHLSPYKLNLTNKYPTHTLSADIDATLTATDIDHAMATLNIKNTDFTSPQEPSLHMENLTFTLDTKNTPAQIHLDSDFITADMEGDFTLSTLPAAIKNIAAQTFPALVTPQYTHEDTPQNDLTLTSTIKYSDNLNKFLNLPITIIYPITLNATLQTPQNNLTIDVSAPYLQQKDKLIENTALHISTANEAKTATLTATTTTPTKNGAMDLNITVNAAQNRIDTQTSWHIDRKKLYAGTLDISTLLSKDETNALNAQIDINPSKLTFNDTTWTVNHATITAAPRNIKIDNFDVRRENQYITMQGTASDNPEDIITLNLLNVNLDYIFESLGIDKALIGGDATGTFYAQNIFTSCPSVITPALKVKNISYNKTVFGNADIKSHWDNDKKEITLDADITSHDGNHSYVTGGIYPLNDSLDITFNADKIDVRFLKPYMEAFTSDINGTASGRARLFGTFKYIDLEGDIFAQDLKLKIDFTNTTYTATDSVHITPGKIKIDKILLKDREGNTAYLKGEVRHKFFKEPEFDFYITDAKNFLSYDITSKQNPDWYGTIYGTGGATITGVPGTVNIYVDMTTAPKSTFTFVLSDQQTATEYNFITFRDRNRKEIQDTTTNTVPQLIRSLKQRMAATQDNEPSVYNMTLQVNVTPTAQLILVMDPVGGDKIKANGTGNLRMDYGSANEDLKMYGKYTLDKGSYNFTLQDIIIKDFTIKPGSTIAFTGDPYAAQLDLKAYYALNANLSDLDETFLQDKDLNRTNVPVHALMNVTSDIRSPEITFDLEFPTLTSDTYRKVKSIISTDDMMNRQIIYLLALNRFYTPDYMGATTKGSELVSVASSTISSQLSSMLGQLSDNWTIAPNFRSDKGDFSDVEVDLALSSTLLNNRLLFNGNFGYRDNTMNTNQFIGDFDLEYLLNKSGSIRLKAYNRYNDQNFYVKTATTTQGIGIVYRRDFDHILSFLYRLKQKRKQAKQNTGK